MGQYVDIHFDCLPLRSVGRMDIPLDASPKFRAKCERIKQAMAKHGSHNAYFLHQAVCRFHLTNSPELGLIEFSFEGTVLTDEEDARARSTDLSVELVRETCDWLTQPVVEWLRESVSHAVRIEFDRYVEAGDLARTVERVARLQAQAEQSGGFLGMYL